MNLRHALALLALAAAVAPGTASAHSRHAQCVRCTPEQRDAFRTTEELVERLFLEGRRAYQGVKKLGYEPSRMREYLDGLQASFSEAWRAHEAFLATLDEDAEAALAVRIGRVESMRREVLNRFDGIEELIGDAERTRWRSIQQFRRLSCKLDRWRHHLDKMEWHAEM